MTPSDLATSLMLVGILHRETKPHLRASRRWNTVDAAEEEAKAAAVPPHVDGHPGPGDRTSAVALEPPEVHVDMHAGVASTHAAEVRLVPPGSQSTSRGPGASATATVSTAAGPSTTDKAHTAPCVESQV